MIDDGARERNLPSAGLDVPRCQKLPCFSIAEREE